MALARTMQESTKERRRLLIDALYYRRIGARKAKQAALNGAGIEKLNQKYFLGDPPF